MKKLIARTLLRWHLPRFLNDPHGFNRLLGHAVLLQLRRTTDEAFRVRLEEFYQSLDPESAKRDIDFDAKAKQLDKPGGYKINVSAIGGRGVSENRPGRLDTWGRRFGLLRHVGVRSDVLILPGRNGPAARPPPRGLWILSAGRVAARHYDRVREVGDKLLVRKVLDADLEPGGFTTNSEFFHNIHWLQGLADRSFLFRVTVTDTPVTAFGTSHGTHSRLYVDPTGEPDGSDVITASYVNEDVAKRLFIRPGSAN